MSVGNEPQSGIAATRQDLFGTKDDALCARIGVSASATEVVLTSDVLAGVVERAAFMRLGWILA